MRRVLRPLMAIWLAGVVDAGAVNVLTQHNDNSRTGANLNETVLTTANVNSTQFGKLWSYPVTGQVYAQPLHVDGVTIGGVVRNVLYVATMHNSVYAFDAQSASTTPLWSVNLGPSVPMPSTGLGTSGPCTTYQDILGEIGILSTPVIDLATNTMYVEAKTKEGTAYIDRIHALDITTGAEKMGGPVPITASVSGTAGARTLDSLRANQRSSLLLANGRVYVSFSSYCDSPSYYGWVIGYSASNLAQAPLLYNDVQDGTQAGIWMSGAAPSADASGNVYVASGNGSFNGNTTGGRNLGNSVIKLSSTLGMLDWFTPYNQSSLNSSDLDLGSSGLLLVPGSSLVVAGGKEGKIYLLNSGSLGHFHSGSDSQIVQSFMSSGTHLHGAPVYWNSPSGALVYVGAESDYIKGYRLTSGLFATSPFTQTGFTSPANAMPGSILSVSANGSASGTGILWANMTVSRDANHATVPGVLRAFDAANLSIELWNSQQNAARDSFGNHAKYCPPTIANGRVYMATFSNQVAVYGLLSAATPTATATATTRVTATATATTGATPTFTPTPAAVSNVAQGKPITASSVQQTFVAGNANDGSVTTYWEGAANTYPNTLTVSLGADYAISSIVVKVNPASTWATRTQTFAILGHTTSTSTFSTLVASATYTFNPSTNANTVTIPLTATASDVRLSFTANSGATGGQVAELQVLAGAGGPTPTFTTRPIATATARPTPIPGNLALGKPVVVSSLESSQYPAANAVDGNTATRWSSAFSDPQWIRVDLGAVTPIAHVRLNWEAAYGRSYQVQASTDAVTWTTLFTTTTGDGGIDDLTGLAGSGRYVRMWGTVRAISAGYSLWELEVYAQ
jgi:hypothetical protein